MAYRGSVTRLPVGILGLSGSRNPTQLQPGHFEFAEGVSIDGGLIQKEGGASKLNTTALGGGAAVVSGIHYTPTAGAGRDVVYLDTGVILKDTGDGTFAITMVSGLTATQDPPPHFIVAGGESVGSPPTLFMFSETNLVRVVDGDGNTMAVISAGAADWSGPGNQPTFGVVHGGRLWAGGNASDMHRIYYTTTADHQNFAGGGTLAIFPGVGDRLVAGISFKGLLILWKYPRGIFIVDTNDPSPANWTVRTLTSAIGGLNQHCIVPVDNDVLYMETAGHIHMLSATDEFGGINTSDLGSIADIPEFVRSEVNRSALIRAVGVWYSAREHAIFALPGSGLNNNTIRLTADFSFSQVPVRFFTSRRDIPVSMWLRPDADGVYKPVHGDDAGFIWLMDQDTRNKDGAGYQFRFETSSMDLSFADSKLASINKTGDFLELIFEPQGDWDLIVQVIWDDVPGPPILFSMGGNGSPLGAFTLDTDILVGDAIRSVRKRIAGQGRRVRITANNFGADDNIAISDFLLSFRTTNEKGKPNG